ncbi:hypothetical protein [Paractinoplanes durhamensis]|uniref:Uncharacterized protein n=1 Tax=Paractinoplanes durhamensis TaxID=113563 RepID=A0ABQ3YZL9_9ACTN|nr:hypothetical protein [Actinoplanes durhamensis]GIE03020.1 hypothetical protein Adu01nite_43700 [Actinoplanes durhamensis]
MLNERLRLLRLLPRGGRGLTVALVALQLVRSVLPAGPAVAVGRLTAALFGQGSGQVAAVMAAGGSYAELYRLPERAYQ